MENEVVDYGYEKEWKEKIDKLKKEDFMKNLHEIVQIENDFFDFLKKEKNTTFEADQEDKLNRMIQNISKEIVESVKHFSDVHPVLVEKYVREWSNENYIDLTGDFFWIEVKDMDSFKLDEIKKDVLSCLGIPTQVIMEVI